LLLVVVEVLADELVRVELVLDVAEVEVVLLAVRCA